MSSATPMIIPEKSQQAFIELHRQCYTMLNQQWNIREQMQVVDRAYQRENDFTAAGWKARLANRYGDPTKFQNVVVPVVMPAVEAAVTYQSSVFLTGTPIFGFVAPPDQEDAAMMYQAIMEENSIRGAWTQHLMIFFRDCFKYNLGIVECVWDRVVTAAIETDFSFTAGKQGKPKNVIWEGNCVKRWDPYNTFWDSRYKPTEISRDGEFVGTTQLMSRVHLKKFINELPDKMVSNVIPAFESGWGSAMAGGVNGGIESYYIPQINPEALLNRNHLLSIDWMAWAGLLTRPPGEMLYKNLYEVTTLYARIIPQDFGLNVPAKNTPQVWKLIIINHQVLIYCERQTNAHNFLPVLFGQPNEDGLGYQTKSYATNAKPFQEIASALVNSAMAARRRSISDRGIYDPSRISEAHINSDSPTAKIPLRPAGYGKPINEAYYSIPFRDENSVQAFQELPQILRMADVVNGSNAAKQGQFVKGNKTQHEYESVMANANGRDQMTAMLLEGQVFTPMKEMFKLNILQYQAAGSMYSPSLSAMVQIDPIALRKSAATFKVSDGLTPTDKLISSDDFTIAMQTIATSPAIGAAYNIGPMFSYLMKTKNLDLKFAEKSPAQQAYEQASQQWQEVVLQAIKGGAEQKSLPPQPKPQDYGYVPGQVQTAPGVSAAAQPTPLAPAIPNAGALSAPTT